MMDLKGGEILFNFTCIVLLEHLEYSYRVDTEKEILFS